jgi:anti-anti-sigma factor
MDGFKLLPAADEHLRLRVTLVGEFDLAALDDFVETVTPAIDSGEYREIEFDLARLTFIDSSGLHALTEADRAMRARGGTVSVVGVAPHLLEVFELTRLDRVLTIVSEPVPARAAA